MPIFRVRKAPWARIYHLNGFIVCCRGSGNTHCVSDSKKRCTSQELRQGFAPSKFRAVADKVITPNDSVFGAQEQVTGSATKELIFQPTVLLGVLLSWHAHTLIYDAQQQGERSKSSTLQVARQSGWKRCHQFVPSHGGHGGDREAVAVPCPHHG